MEKILKKLFPFGVTMVILYRSTKLMERKEDEAQW
jgi:hypothetical protein